MPTRYSKRATRKGLEEENEEVDSGIAWINHLNQAIDDLQTNRTRHVKAPLFLQLCMLIKIATV